MTVPRIRSAFFGTPDIAVPALQAVARITDLKGVVCQPDRPRGRGQQVQSPAVKLAAQQLGVPVFQPLRVKDGSLATWLRELNVEVAVVMAYGRILPKEVLQTPRFGCVNLHASLLPKYRGAAPINWCLYYGETETGVALMQMDEGLDTGPVYAVQRLPIAADWDAGDLSRELSACAARSVEIDLPSVFAGAVPSAQDHALSSHAPPIKGPELEIDWSNSAQQVHQQVRAFGPRPGAHTWLDGKRLRILRSHVVDASAGSVANPPTPEVQPGLIEKASGNALWVRTATGLFAIERAQLEGKRELDARDLVNGRTLQVNSRLGTQLLSS